jgi:hypothetical protein
MKEHKASPMSSGSLASSRSWLFARIWGGFLLVLVMATYPLWFPPLDPQSSLSVPLITGISSISGGWALVPSITLLFGLVIAVSTRESARMKIGWIVVAASLLLSFLLDQHRLQPWAYQSFFYALIFSSMSASAGHKWIMPLAASVYLYSAAGKFDFQFQHTVGQDLMAALAGFLGGLPDGFNAENAARLALLLPAVEFVAGVGLCLRRTRRLSVIVLIMMHGSLLILLGPLGLNHSRGVLLWNVMLIVQAYFIFWIPPDKEKRPAASDSEENKHLKGVEDQTFLSGIIARSVKCLIVLACLCPLTERKGYWDHWTSWSLYSPHTSRAEIELHRSVVGNLNPQLVEFLENDEDGDGWQRLSLESWSLASRFVPIYPQARYQLAIANQLCLTSDLDEQIRVKLRGVSDRWTGRRSEDRLIGKQQIAQACRNFWLYTGKNPR